MRNNLKKPVFPVVSLRASDGATVTVFYANLLYGQYSPLTYEDLLSLPEGAYLYCPSGTRHWFRKDLTPVLDEDVPSTAKMLLLLLK